MVNSFKYLKTSSIGIILGAVLLCLPNIAWGASYVVNSPLDDSDGTCVNPYVNSATDCTLREAITAANASVGADTITFAMDVSFQSDPTYYSNGQYTITVGSVLDSITEQLTITAASVWDNTNNRPGVRLYNSGTAFNAFTISSGATSSMIAGLEISGFNAAVRVNAASVIVGTNCDGALDTQERNVLHGGVNGVYITTASNIVAGNIIGLDYTGDTYLGYTNESVYLNGAGADSNMIGFRSGTTGSCSASTQRNIIAGSTLGVSSAVTLIGTGTANAAGDATLGPDHNHAAGNYIGLDLTGTKDRSGLVGGSGNGVLLSTNATLNWIGTDGDGVDDAAERNVIYGTSSGVNVLATGANRVAGNYVGTTTSGNTLITGGSMTVGILLRGTANIAGWCDTTVHATLCSDSGALADERNVTGGSSLDGIRFGFDSLNGVAYGNYVGVGADGTSDVGNVTSGIYVHRASNGNTVGGTGNKTNLIQNNGVGVLLNGDYNGNRTNGANQSPIINTTITRNTISHNDASGIQLYWTENFGASSITLSNNTIQNNGTVGIDVYGSSPIITNNTISSNASYGIYVRVGYIKRNAGGGWNANEATTSYDPADAATNLLSSPTITGNTISSNTGEGIYQLDCKSSNYATLFADNTISGNNNKPAVTQAWYGAIEVLDRNDAAIPAASWAGTTVTTQSQASAAAAAVTGADMIFGPASVAYTNVTTWFTFTDYTVNDSGVTTSFNPSTITAAGTYTNSTGSTYRFDGADNDTTYAGVLVNGITTSGLYRFQIAKVVTSTVPTTPSNVTPTTGSTTSTVTPTLTASDFSDSTDTHASTAWQVYSSSALCTAGAAGDVYSTTSSTHLTSLSVPDNTLTGATQYYWRVAYTNSFGNTSAYSSCTAFTTIRTTPQQDQTIPNISWNEDETLPNAFDLDDYFSDAQGKALTYSFSLSEANNITVAVDATSYVVSFGSSTNWFGTATLAIIVCDTDNQCITSNTSTITVNSVNDVPLAPTTNFSPTGTITTLKPTMSWDAGTDTEDSATQLYYEIWLSTHSTVSDNPELKLTSAIGSTTYKITDALIDHTTYYYIVRTIDSAGTASDWSAIQSFTTKVATQPSLTLIKSVEIVSSDLSGNTVAGITGFWSIIKWLAQQITLAALVICAAAALVAVAGLLRRLPKLTQIFVVLTQQPALAFSAVTNQDQTGQYQSSYAEFGRKVLPFRTILKYSFIALVIFMGLNLAVRTLAGGTVTAIVPGDTIRYIVQYQNSGDASATNTILHDTLPDNVTLQTSTVLLKHDGKTQQISDSAVGANQQLTVSLAEVLVDGSGTVQYDVLLNNPISATTLSASAATVTAAELNNQVVESNTVSLPIESAAANITVQTSAGTPVANTALQLYQTSVSAANEVWTGTTNDQGVTQITGLRAGTYWVTVSTDSSYNPVDPQSIQLSYNVTTTTVITLSSINTGAGGGTNSNTNDSTSTNVNTNTVSQPLELNTNINANTTTQPNHNTNAVPVVIQQPIPNLITQPRPVPITTPAQLVQQTITQAVVTVANAVKYVAKTTAAALQTAPGAALAHSAQTVGLAAWTIGAGSELLLATPAVTSFSDIYLVVARFFGALFGLRKKKQPWGVVYDAMTKRPLDPAYITITSKTGKMMKDGITDLDGRYEFFLKPGQYKLEAKKTHYQFPSQRLVGQSRDVLYDNLYFGDVVHTKTGEVITRNIPLDPVGFDWNEFEKNKEHQFRFFKKRQFVVRLLGYGSYFVGFALAAIIAFAQPSWLNLSLFGVYCLIAVYQAVWLPKRKAVSLLYTSGEPIAYAIIRVYSAHLKREVKYTVTDEYGRFYMLLEPGHYYWTVESRQPYDKYKVIYQSKPVHLKSGVIKKNIVVPKA